MVSLTSTCRACLAVSLTLGLLCLSSPYTAKAHPDSQSNSLQASLSIIVTKTRLSWQSLLAHIVLWLDQVF